MPDFFAKSNRNVTAPSFQRSRQRLRGSRESEKMNLEVAQFYYDVARLYERLKDVRARLTANTAAINDDTTSLTFYESATPNTYFVEGTVEIATRISQLEERIRFLEGQ